MYPGEQLYRTIFENCDAVMLLIDPSTGAIVDANPAACRFYGYTAQVLTSLNLSALRLADEREMFEQMRRFADGRQKCRTFQHRLASGEVRDVEVQSCAVVVDGRQLLYSIIHDVTERRHLETAIRASARHYASLFRNSPGPLCEEDYSEVKRRIDELKARGIADIPGYLRQNEDELQRCADLVRFNHANEAALAMFGVRDLEELVARFPEILAGEAKETFLRVAAGIAAGETSFSREVTAPNLSGRSMSIRISWRVAPECARSFARVYTSIADLTDVRRAEAALKESSELMTAIVQGVDAGIMVYDLERRYLLWNPYMEWMTGLSREEVLGKLPEELFPHIVDYELPVLMKRALDGETCVSRDVIFPAKPGREPRWYYVMYLPYRDGRGNIVGIIGLATDITERKIIEQRMAESERRFRECLENVRLLAVILDTDGKVTFCNHCFLDVSGYAREEVIGMHWKDRMLPPEEREGFAAVFDRVVSTGELNERYETPFITAKGERRIVAWHSTFLYDRQGRVSGFTCIGEDITERRATEQALHESEERLRLIIANSPDHFFIQDRELHYVWHGSWEVRSATGTFDKTDHDFFPPEIAGLLIAAKSRVVAAGAGERLEQRVPSRRGGHRDLEIIFEPWKDSAGAVLGLYGYVHDITDLKRAEKTLAESEHKLRSVIEQLNEGIVLVDSDGTIIEWNIAQERITGIRREDMVGKRLSEIRVLFRENDGPVARMHAEIYEVLQGRGDGFLNRLNECVVRNIGGAQKTIQYAHFLIHCDGKVIAGVSVRDLTLVRQMERTLQMTEQKYRTVMESIPLGIALIGPDMRVQGVNRQMRDWFSDFSGGPQPFCFMVYRRRDSICPDCPCLLSFADGEVHEMTIPSLAAEGAFHRVQSSPVKDRNGRVILVVEVVEDITEKKKAEQELQSYQEKLRSLSAELALVEERERRRIATYLHDNVGQALTMAKIKLGELKELAAGTPVAPLVTEVRDQVMESIRYTRSLTFELSLPILYELGFVAAVEWLAEQTQERSGIACVVERSGSGDPDNEVKVILFRVVRELLLNIIKHAGAKKVRLQLTLEGEQITIVVEDDGVGFDIREVGTRMNSSGGFGLFSVREQMAYLQGDILMVSAPGGGARVKLTAPLRFAKQEQGRTRENENTDRR